MIRDIRLAQGGLLNKVAHGTGTLPQTLQYVQPGRLGQTSQQFRLQIRRIEKHPSLCIMISSDHDISFSEQTPRDEESQFEQSQPCVSFKNCYPV
jgi:hypothetical protein